MDLEKKDIGLQSNNKDTTGNKSPEFKAASSPEKENDLIQSKHNKELDQDNTVLDPLKTTTESKSAPLDAITDVKTDSLPDSRPTAGSLYKKYEIDGEDILPKDGSGDKAQELVNLLNELDSGK